MGKAATAALTGMQTGLGQAVQQSIFGHAKLAQSVKAVTGQTLKSLGEQYQVEALGAFAAGLAHLFLHPAAAAGDFAAAAAYEAAALAAGAGANRLGGYSGGGGGAGGGGAAGPSPDVGNRGGGDVHVTVNLSGVVGDQRAVLTAIHDGINKAADEGVVAGWLSPESSPGGRRR
jgi:hypothetical protein